MSKAPNATERPVLALLRTPAIERGPLWSGADLGRATGLSTDAAEAAARSLVRKGHAREHRAFGEYAIFCRKPRPALNDHDATCPCVACS